MDHEALMEDAFVERADDEVPELDAFCTFAGEQRNWRSSLWI